ncbi:MAG: SIS domain-containing protein [Candidatus Eremiobacterota bacterium]
MCGISGIVHNIKENIIKFNPDTINLIKDRLKSMSCDSPEGFSEILSDIEPFVDNLFAFGNFYEIYSSPLSRGTVEELAGSLEQSERELDRFIKHSGVSISMDVLEQFNSVFIRVRDLIWRIREDLFKNISKIKNLAQDSNLEEKEHFIHELWKLNFTLNNLNRLEVRGRDSAGLSCIVSFENSSGLKNFKETLQEKLKHDYEERIRLKDFVNCAIVEASSCNSKDMDSLVFTFKVAEEIGKMGDNVATLRKTIQEDKIFLTALSGKERKINMLAHTRWASNGIINQQNCHPVNNQTEPLPGTESMNKDYLISAVLNGDIDNFQELKEKFSSITGRKISDNVTTDAKIIPLIVEKFYEETGNLYEAFRLALNEFRGSMAIAMHSTIEPEKVYLALRGSGQALFVGFANGGYVFASELYGIVEESSRFIKLDGEKERITGNPSTQGQIFVLDQSVPGGIEFIKAFYFDGVPLVITEKDIKKSEINTRDINIGQYPHFLLKEISESPLSVEKTLRGKFEIRETSSGVLPFFNLGKEIIPDLVLNKLKRGDIKKICVIGQGTASIAGNGIANFMSRVLSSSGIQIMSTKATELSGFLLEDDMSGLLAIAVSQSGTTTDTNRTVDLLRARGARVISIVNRRNSDLVYKSDGVFYTSDGRDIEMSVASTKAFYSQIVSGTIIALYFAGILSTLSSYEIVQELRELQSLPDKMYSMLSQKDDVREVAEKYAVTKKYWAVVGSGPYKIASDEIRIKLSELCYKSIASDTTEDKKHIDLSSEPLVIICVAGVSGSNLHDMVKEVAIFKAHKACPVVIATEDQEPLFKPYAKGIIKTPHASGVVSVLLNTMAGHLWGYYAARAIDNSAAILKTARASTVEALVNSTRGDLYEDRAIIKSLSRKLYAPCKEFFYRLRSGLYNSCLEVNTASELSLLLKYVQGKIPLEDFEIDFGKSGSLNTVLNETVRFLSSAIADLTRPIDAIKHQAKTVTVGISRLEEIPEGLIFETLKEENISLNNITYQNTFILQSINPAVDRITGLSFYEITDLDPLGYPADNTQIITLYKKGSVMSLSSRSDKGCLLIGRKRSVVAKNRVFAGRGNSDERPIIIIPLFDKGICRNLLLLHTEFKEKADIQSKVILLKALDKYEDIKYTVTEMNIIWDDLILEHLSPLDLISEDPDHIAELISCYISKE